MAGIIDGRSYEDKSSWFSYIFMTYLDSLFAQGAAKPLEMADLGPISEQDECAMLYEKFKIHMDHEKLKPIKQRSLWGVLWRTVGLHKLFIAMTLFLMAAALQFGPVEILSRLVKHFEGIVVYNTAQLWIMVALLFVFPMTSSIFLAHSNAIMCHLGAQIRNTLIGVIYRKSLVISSYRRQSLTTGRIITMFSDDTNQIRAFMFFMNNALGAPFQIAACLYLIYQQVGVATFVGLGYTFLTVPFTGMLFGIVASLRRQKMSFTDGRVKLMNEVLSGIRIIKYYSWEKAFVKQITEIRNKEMHMLEKMGYLFNSAFGLILLGAPQVQTVLIFYTYIALGNELDAATAFTTLTLFGLMTSPFIFLPFGIQQYSQSRVSTTRIMEFLCADEIEVYVQEATIDSANAIEFVDANLSWVPENVTAPETAPPKLEAVVTSGDTAKTDEAVVDAVVPKDLVDRSEHTLTNFNLKIARGELVAIVGSVGCGKSSILSALLGEMHLRSGSVHLAAGDRIAYCDQRPWIINATVKENILFGKDYDEVRFFRAIKACAMEDDIKILPNGVMTEIGERGINLSGGQKARVSLARSVYNDADIYMLDDPLSAVDAHVGEHIFTNCIKENLRGKTVLLVTHHLQVLPMCDRIVILETDGTIKATGTYTDICNSHLDLSLYISSPKEEEDAAEETEEASDSAVVRKPRSGSVDQADGKTNAKGKEVAAKQEGNGKDLITKEEIATGSVPWATYESYILHGGAWAFASVVLFQMFSQVLQIEANFWLGDWGKATTIDAFERHPMTVKTKFHWLHGYAGMQMASVFFMTMSRVALTYHRTHASRKLHENLLGKILLLPVAFFDTTPIGRIINRFSQDVATIDEDLAQNMSQVIGMGGACAGSVGAIAGSTKGTFLLLFVPLGFIYSKIQTYFRASNTAIARLEANSRSPIYADFSQTLSGTSTIRAYRRQPAFVAQLVIYTNSNTVPGLFQQLAAQWLSIRLDFLGSLVMLFMGMLAVFSQKSAFIPAGYLALGLSYSIQLTSMLKMTVRVLSTMEASFNAVDRVHHYAAKMEVEGQMINGVVLDGSASDRATEMRITAAKAETAPSDAAGDIELGQAAGSANTQLIVPPADWPQHGVVRFENVSMAYRDGPLVLKNVSFDVNSEDKIGIAGRTGCGKSSLMVVLFRIECLQTGKVFIDDIDISRIALTNLRSKLCIIPQDPVMFSATVRFNLDPFNEYSDEEIWDILKSVNMSEHVRSLKNKLDEMVAEGGDNFSAGQRQLVCIARAILRKPKILVLDEATASIDRETDEFIQLMIREKFRNCTVLTIAHRLHTIIDSTKIIVMDQGHLAEFDTPAELLNKENGLFKNLWEAHATANEGSSSASTGL